MTVAILVIAALTAGMAGAYGRSGNIGYSYADLEAQSDAHDQRTHGPSAGFGPYNAKVGDVKFEGWGTPGSNSEATATSYSWDLGNDGTQDATGETPTLKLAEEGDHDVRLTVTFSDGKSAFTIGSVHVTKDRPPVVNLYANGELRAGRPVTFQSSAYDPDGTSQAGSPTYDWDFGDGTPHATSTNPTHTYADAGTYRVALTVTWPDGSKGHDVWYATVVAPQTPSASLYVGQPMLNSATAFHGSGSSDAGQPTSYLWDFGGGATATTQNPSHTYTTPGVKTVKLTVTFADRTTASQTRKFTIRSDDQNAGYASWYTVHSSPVKGQDPQFGASANKPGWTVVSYDWSFGDGTSKLSPVVEDQQERQSHPYSAAGLYDVRLWVKFTNAENETSYEEYVWTLEVRETSPPIVSWSASSHHPAPKAPVTFQAFAYDPEDYHNTVETWAWDFGDGSTSSAAKPTHTFAEEGVYEIKVTATFANGETATRTNVMNVRSSWAFGGSAVVMTRGIPRTGMATTFASYVPGGPPGQAPTLQWAFGDGATATGLEPEHTYAESGFYKVVLTASYGDGTTLKGVRWIQVGPDEAAVAGTSWRPQQPVGEALVTIHGAWYDTDDNRVASAYRWDFGNDGSVEETTKTHTVSRKLAPGTHEVKLTVQFADGGSASRVRSIVVAGLPAGAEQVSEIVPAGATVSTGNAATPADPIEVGLTTEAPGAVTVTDAPVDQTPPQGYGFFGRQINITAPDAPSVDKPLKLVFLIDPSLVPAGTDLSKLKIFRNGAPVEPCATVVADRKFPCELPRTAQGRFEILTLRASAWNVGLAGASGVVADPTLGTSTGGTGNGGSSGGSDGANNAGGNQQTPTAPAAPATPPKPPVSTGPAAVPLTLTVSGAKQKAAKARTKGVVVKVTCSAACATDIRLTFDKGTAKKLKLSGALGTATATLAAAGSKTVSVKLTAKAKKALKKLRKGQIIVTATGGGKTATGKVALSR